MSNGERFIVIDDSHSAHCCFSHSVIDTNDGKDEFGKWVNCICETFSLDDAETICEALNECSPIDPKPIIDVSENVQQTLNVIETKNIINSMGSNRSETDAE